MDIYEIESFLTLIELKNFSLAAKKLCITQPTLSKRIKHLESNLGCELIIRHAGKRTIQLTPYGKKFKYLAYEFIAVQKKIKTFTNYTMKKKLQIGTSDSLHYSLLEVYTNFKELFPDISLSLKNRTFKSCYTLIENQQLDLAIVGAEIQLKNVQVVKLYEEKMIFICNKNANYPDVISPTMLNLSDMIYSPYSSEFISWIDKWFSLGEKPFITTELIYQVKQLMEVIPNEKIWTIIPESFMPIFFNNKNIQSKKLQIPIPKRKVYLITNTNNTNAYLPMFLSLLNTHYVEK